MNASQDNAGDEVDEVYAAVAFGIRTCRRHRQFPPPVDVAVAMCLVMPVEHAVSGFTFGSEGYFYICDKPRSLMYHKTSVKGEAGVEMENMT